VVVLGVIAAAAGVEIEDESAVITIGGTFVQDTVFIGTAIFYARMAARPRPWHFGLRGAHLGWTVLWSFVGLAAFWGFNIVYSAIVTDEGEQTVGEDLGADQGLAFVILGAIVVVVMAPIAEEFFFRGFCYRALRSKMNMWFAATIVGVVFGLIHFTGTDTLPILPSLAVLGFVFCIVYEVTGTLYSVIGLHALNNAIAWGVETDNAPVAIVFGVLMIAACFVLPRIVWRDAPALR
jgi:uncharacterized protein